MISPWLVSRSWDLRMSFGGAGLGMALAAWIAWQPSSIGLVLILWWTLVEGPHFVLTWMLITDPSLTPELVRKRNLALLWLFPGIFLAIACALGLPRVALDVYLLGVALWGFWHLIKQNWGIYRLVSSRCGIPAADTQRDGRLYETIQWGMLIAVFIVAPLLQNLPVWGVILQGIVWGLIFVTAFVWGIRVMKRGQQTWPLLAHTVPFLLISAISYTAIARLEPLLPGATTAEQKTFALALAPSFFHGVQYMMLGLPLGERRQVLGFRHGKWLALSTAIVVSISYAVLHLGRNSIPAWSFQLPDYLVGLLIGIYGGVLCHHYAVDGFYWKQRHYPRWEQDLAHDA